MYCEIFHAVSKIAVPLTHIKESYFFRHKCGKSKLQEKLHQKLVIDLYMPLSAVATGEGGRAPLTGACTSPFRILVYSKYFFATSCNDKTTDNNGKRNSNV